jgi:NAD/NADP octopine/nopaline dehydrogenase, alpha-helical domain/Ketopantoate reductase PanE/ApbA
VRVAVCGGGSLAHAVAAVLGAREELDVRVLTRQPQRWSRKVRGIYLDIAEIRGIVALASSEPQEVVAGADMVVLCVPSCARGQVLTAIAPFLETNAWVGSFPGFGGFDWQARSILGAEARVFGLQRVPYVRKTISYGEAVWISGIRPRLVLGALPSSEAPALARLVEELMGIPTDPTPSYLPVTMSASNPVFHPARTYSAFSNLDDGAVLPERRLFYEDWDDAASLAYLALDDELQSVCRALKTDMSAAQPIRAHYGVDDAPSLTRRIQSLRSLRDRYLPLAPAADGYGLDVHTSYFTEDIPYGLLVIKAVADVADVSTPAIDAALHWAQRVMRRRYLVGDRLQGPDVIGLPLPRRFGLSTAEALVAAAT